MGVVVHIHHALCACYPPFPEIIVVHVTDAQSLVIGRLPDIKREYRVIGVDPDKPVHTDLTSRDIIYINNTIVLTCPYIRVLLIGMVECGMMRGTEENSR